MFLSQFLRDNETTLKALSEIIYACTIDTSLIDLHKFRYACHIPIENPKYIASSIAQKVYNTKNFSVTGQCVKFYKVSLKDLMKAIIEYDIDLESFIVQENTVNKYSHTMELVYIYRP